MKRVYILGGGIAGLEAAISLRNAGFAVTVVSDRAFVYIYPMAIWIPTGEKVHDDICLSLDELAHAHGFEYLIDPVVGINAHASTISLASGKILSYEYAIVALGSSPLLYNGQEYTNSVCGDIKAVETVKEKLDVLLARKSGVITAGFAGNPDDITGVRGEPAFEFIFNLHNYLKKIHLREQFSLVFFSPEKTQNRLLGDKAEKSFHRFFTKLKIDCLFERTVHSFQEGKIIFDNGEERTSDLTMFVPGRRGNAILQNSDLPLNSAGFIQTLPSCHVVGFDNIFAIGDTVALLDASQWNAKHGHVAEIMARNAAFNIFSKENGSDAVRSYTEQLNLLFMLDRGNAASLVYKDARVDLVLSIPVIGHWIKKGWGRYYKLSRLKKIPRLPGA